MSNSYFKKQMPVLIGLFCAITLNAQVINVPGDYSTIQEAIDYSWDGDTIIVRPATYNEAIKFNGRKITLTSLNPDNVAIWHHDILRWICGNTSSWHH